MHLELKVVRMAIHGPQDALGLAYACLQSHLLSEAYHLLRPCLGEGASLDCLRGCGHDGFVRHRLIGTQLVPAAVQFAAFEELARLQRQSQGSLQNSRIVGAQFVRLQDRVKSIGHLACTAERRRVVRECLARAGGEPSSGFVMLADLRDIAGNRRDTSQHGVGRDGVGAHQQSCFASQSADPHLIQPLSVRDRRKPVGEFGPLRCLDAGVAHDLIVSAAILP